jgi:hypothetical protein
LFTQTPTAQPPFDGGVHLQAGGVVATGAVRFAREHRSQVDEHGDGRLDPAERLLDGLTVVAD